MVCMRTQSGGTSGGVNIFDRGMKGKQKKWAAALPDCQKYDYLRDEV